MPRISEETIRKVAEATDIVELIGAYFPLKRAGSSWRALCPFHNEKTPSFHVNPSRQSYKCFGCGAGGSVFRFLMDYEHLEFSEAVRRLATRAGIPVVEAAGGAATDDKAQDKRRRLLAIHTEAALWMHQNLLKSEAAQNARDYLKSRGLASDTARSWQIGYAPDSWDALLNHLRQAGFSNAELLQSGLAVAKDDRPGSESHLYARFRGRIMFPVRNDFGEVIAFSGRLLESNPTAAKYVNSPETPLFSKGRILYGLDKSKRALIEKKTAIVLEGQIDVISAFESGVTNVLAPQGTAFTPEQARLLSRFVESVVLCFDADRAGQEAAVRSLPALIGCGLRVGVAPLPEGHDPDSLIRAEGPEAFLRVIEKSVDFFDHATTRLIKSGVGDDPARMAAATLKLAGFVALVKDPVARDAIAGKICSKLGIAPSSFLSQMKSVRPPRENSSVAPDGETEPPVPMELSEGVAILCRLAALSPECREFLQSQDEPPAKTLGPGAGLLVQILNYPEVLDSPPALAAFSSSLPPSMEQAFAALDLSLPPQDPLECCRSAWSGLAAQLLRQKSAAIQARMRNAGLKPEELAELQKQILDVSARLNDLT